HQGHVQTRRQESRSHQGLTATALSPPRGSRPCAGSAAFRPGPSPPGFIGTASTGKAISVMTEAATDAPSPELLEAGRLL
ncbi:hypothetical protein C4M77_28475, partial [Escherichia coli]